jgi:hypothetical protein
MSVMARALVVVMVTRLMAMTKTVPLGMTVRSASVRVTVTASPRTGRVIGSQRRTVGRRPKAAEPLDIEVRNG